MQQRTNFLGKRNFFSQFSYESPTITEPRVCQHPRAALSRGTKLPSIPTMALDPTLQCMSSTALFVKNALSWEQEQLQNLGAKRSLE